MDFRKANVQDCGEIAKINVDGWKNSYKNFMPKEILDNRDINKKKEVIKEQILSGKEYYLFGDEHTKEIFGYVTFGDPLENIQSYDCEIYAFYLKPKKIRNGYGSIIINKVKNIFKSRGKKTMIVWCLKENTIGRSFYSKKGGNESELKKININGYEFEEIGFKFSI